MLTLIRNTDETSEAVCRYAETDTVYLFIFNQKEYSDTECVSADITQEIYS